MRTIHKIDWHCNKHTAIEIVKAIGAGQLDMISMVDQTIGKNIETYSKMPEYNDKDATKEAIKWIREKYNSYHKQSRVWPCFRLRRI